MDKWCCYYVHSRKLAVAKWNDLLVATQGANGIAWKRNGASYRSISCSVNSAAFHCYSFCLFFPPDCWVKKKVRVIKESGRLKRKGKFKIVVMLKVCTWKKHISLILCILKSHNTMTACTFVQCKKTNNWKPLKGSCHVFNVFQFCVLSSFVVAMGRG